MATFDDAINVQAVGKSFTTAAGSASTTIPITSAGTAPRYMRISATTETYVKVGGAAVAATANDILIQPADAVLLNVQGNSFVAYIQGAVPGRVNFIPLEDQ